MSLSDAFLTVLLGLLTNFLFALIVFWVRPMFSAKNWPDPQSTRPISAAKPAPADSSPTPKAVSRQSLDWRDLTETLDFGSFLWFLGLSVTFIAPFLLGGLVLGIFEDTSFVTERMRLAGDNGSTQYWLGIATMGVIEIAILLFQPWRNRPFGVSAGLALLVFVLAVALPGSRGLSVLPY